MQTPRREPGGALARYLPPPLVAPGAGPREQSALESGKRAMGQAYAWLPGVRDGREATALTLGGHKPLHGQAPARPPTLNTVSTPDRHLREEAEFLSHPRETAQRQRSCKTGLLGGVSSYPSSPFFSLPKVPLPVT